MVFFLSSEHDFPLNFYRLAYLVLPHYRSSIAAKLCTHALPHICSFISDSDVQLFVPQAEEKLSLIVYRIKSIKYKALFASRASKQPTSIINHVIYMAKAESEVELTWFCRRLKYWRLLSNFCNLRCIMRSNR